MAHTNLESYYKINFALIQHHKYSLTEIENMIPWEREIYLSMLQQYIEEENLKAQQRGTDTVIPKINKTTFKLGSGNLSSQVAKNTENNFIKKDSY